VVWVVSARDEPRDHPRVTSAELAQIEAGAFDPTRANREAAPAEPVSGDSRLERPTATRHSWSGVLKNRSLWLLTAAYASMGSVEYLVFYWSEHYFKNVLQFGASSGRIAALIPPLCMAICIPLGGWLSDRLLRVVGYRRCRAAVAMCGMIG